MKKKIEWTDAAEKMYVFDGVFKVNLEKSKLLYSIVKQSQYTLGRLQVVLGCLHVRHLAAPSKK